MSASSRILVPATQTGMLPTCPEDPPPPMRAEMALALAPIWRCAAAVVLRAGCGRLQPARPDANARPDPGTVLPGEEADRRWYGSHAIEGVVGRRAGDRSSTSWAA